MIGAWTMNVSGRVYGPYSSERMRAFASEGRLGPTSLVAREGTVDWHEAREEPEFSEFFSAGRPQAPQPAAQPAAQPSLGAPVSKPSVNATGTYPVAGAGHGEQGNEAGRSQFAIVVDLKSRSPGGLEQAIASLGQSYRLLPNVWIVSTEQTVNSVRNRLVQELGKLDSLFVVDATRGKAAWFNFGPEADVRIRRVWQKAS
jgi:hypothetical protein